MKKTLIMFWLLVILQGCGGAIDVDPDDYNVLYIGHSFGRPFAEKMEDFSQMAGIPNHAQHIVFSGGESGAPDRLWMDEQLRGEIQAYLDTGEIDVLVMICCSVEFKETDGAQDTAIQDFTAYAYDKNPNVRIGLALSWADFPEDYADVSAHRSGTDEAYPHWKDLASNLSLEFDNIDVFTIYHGAAIYELRALYEDGNLSDVEQMTGPKETSIFTDPKGHAANISKDTGALMWLEAIHGVEPASMPAFDSYDADIRAIAESVLTNPNY